MPGGRSTSPAMGVWEDRERSDTHTAPVVPVTARALPCRSAPGLPRLCSPLCHLRPSRFGRRGGTSPGEKGCAHQWLPTDRTILGRRVIPGVALAQPVAWLEGLDRPLAQVLPTLRPCCALRGAIEAPAAYQHGVTRRHMHQPAPQELLQGQAHRPAWRLAPGALGPLGIPQDDLLPSTGEQPPMGEGPAPQVAGQVDQHPMAIGIALAARHVPLLTAQLVAEVLHLLPALPRRGRERALVQPLTDGRQQFAPEHRHDHPQGHQTPVSHGHPRACLAQPSPRHPPVERRMQEQRLAPRVQGRDNPGLGSQILFIAQEL
jgi:hypothetical protein